MSAVNDNYEDGKGKQLNIKRNNSGNSNFFGMDDDTKIAIARIAGFISLALSIVMFILSAIYSPYIAIAGAILFSGGVGTSIYCYKLDESQSIVEQQNMNNEVKTKIQNAKQRGQNEEHIFDSNAEDENEEINNGTSYNLSSCQPSIKKE